MFDDYLKRTVTRNLLKFAAGNAIFCPSCQTVMDWKRTAIIEVNKDGKTLVSKTQCCKCLDKALERYKAVVADHGATLEITDGREWSKRATVRVSA